MNSPQIAIYSLCGYTNFKNQIKVEFLNLIQQIFKVWLHCKLEFKIFNIILDIKGKFFPLQHDLQYSGHFIYFILFFAVSVITTQL